MVHIRFQAIGFFAALILAGCGLGGVAPTGSGTLVVAPAQLTFQTMVAGTTTAAQTVTLRNSGDAAINLQAAVLGGADAAAFSSTNLCGATLAPSASCTLNVTFIPKVLGTFNASLSVGATGFSTQHVSLKGVLSQAVNPVISGKFVYAGTERNNTIAMYTLTPTGALKPNSPAYIPVAQEPHALAVDPLGDFLFAADAQNGDLSVFRIDQNTGLLTQLADVVPAVATGFPEMVIVDPLGRFVYMANRGTGTIATFVIDRAAGRIKPGPVTRSGNSLDPDPSGMVVDHSGKFLYVSNQGESTIAMFAIDQTSGAPTPLDPWQIQAASAFTLHFDPAGKYLYDPVSRGNLIAVFRQDPSTGQLAQASASGTATDQGPTDFTLTSDGKFAYVTDRDANSLSLYSVDSETGALTALPSSPKPLAGLPYIIKLDPSGQLAYICSEVNGIVTERINVDGSLTYIDTAPLSGSTIALAIYPVATY